MSRPTWDEYFMNIAKLTATRSTCHKRGVGCVITRNNRVISTGYNGHLPGTNHSFRVISGEGRELATVHAEANTIASAVKNGASTDNTTCYITHFPCLDCFKLLASSGIKKIIYDTAHRANPVVFELAMQTSITINNFNSPVVTNDTNNCSTWNFDEFITTLREANIMCINNNFRDTTT